MTKQSISLLGALALILAMAGPANALSMTYGGAGDPSLKGTTGSLTIDETSAGSGVYTVEWHMDFAGYEGEVGDHQYLTNIAFKSFTSVSSASVDSIDWILPGDSGTIGWSGGVFPSNVNGGGCSDGSSANMVCITLAGSGYDATLGGSITATFTISGTVMDEWSYRGKFGGESGWVISEPGGSAGEPVPEPSAALIFGLGALLVTASSSRRR